MAYRADRDAIAVEPRVIRLALPRLQFGTKPIEVFRVVRIGGEVGHLMRVCIKVVEFFRRAPNVIRNAPLPYHGRALAAYALPAQ
jgi:hypothetical protein